MKLIVNAHKIELIPEEPVNEKEINISKCKFEFSDDYNTEDLVKEAYFTLDGNTYKQIIVNNECSYPPEVLVKEATIELGVVAYAVEDDEYIERFNPSPVYFQTQVGSLKDHAENSQEITPSELEQYEQALEEGLAQVQNVDIDASKAEHTATITITNRLGEEKSVQVNDGEKGADGEPGITPNIQVGNTTTLPAGSSATVSQRGTQENPIFDFGIPKGEDGQSGGVSDYTQLSSKPKINNVELTGNKSSSDLGIITKDVGDLTYYYTKTEVDNKVSSVYRYKGTVSTYGDLPSTDLVIGDVYNIETADSQHGIDAGDNVAWTGTTWDKLSGNVDLSGYQPLLVSGTNIKTINNASILGNGNITINEGLNAKIYYIDKNATTQELANYFAQWLDDYKNNINDIIYIYSSYSVGICDLVFTYNEGNGTIKLRTSFINNNNDVINYGTRYKNFGFYAKEATITNDTISNQTGWYAESAGYVPSSYNFLSTVNTNEFNPTVNSYNPATAKYAEKMVESVAPVYSSSSTYDVGDFVSYQGKLYKCSTAIATAEAWNSSHWTETQVVNELGGGGSSTPKYYIDGDYAIYNVSPGNYNFTNPSTAWSNVNNLPSTELSEALTYAYSNNKYLVLNIPTTSIPQNVSFTASAKIAYGIGLGITLTGTLVSNRGNILAVSLNVIYSSTQTTATYDQAKIKYTSIYAIGTTNTSTYTPTGNYNPATKKYVDDIATQYTTIPTADNSYVDKIVQYTGTTDNTYTNGYFYKCVNNGGTYSWENIEVQSSGGGAIQKSCEYLIRDNEVMVFIGRALGGLSTLDHLGIKSYLNTVLNDTNINGKSGITLSVQLIDAWFYTVDTIDLSTDGYKSIRVQTATETTLMSGTTNFGINRQSGVVDSNDWSKNLFSNLPSRYTTISGYNSSKTQTLKNVNGSIQWVDD